MAYFAGVRGLGGPTTSEAEQWRVEEQAKVRGRRETLLKERSQIRQTEFLDGLGRVIRNPREEAIERLNELDREIAALDRRLIEIDRQADELRYQPLDIPSEMERTERELTQARQRLREDCGDTATGFSV